MAKIKHLELKWSIASYELIKSCDPLELKFYLWLKLWAINKHSAFPSYRTICADIDTSSATLSKLLARMEQSGRLKIERQAGRNSIYDITWYDNMLVKNSADMVWKTAKETKAGALETKAPTTKETKAERVERKTNRNITITAADRNNLKKLRTLKTPLLGKMEMNTPRERSRTQEEVAPAMRR